MFGIGEVSFYRCTEKPVFPYRSRPNDRRSTPILERRIMPEPSINAERLWDSLMAHGKIGGLDNGGVCREALTPEDIEGRDTFIRWCKEAGMSIGVDTLGTIYATRV